MAAYLIAMEGLSLLLQAVSSLPLLFIETGWSRLHFFFRSCLGTQISLFYLVPSDQGPHGKDVPPYRAA